jgi:hypothetical protein
MEIITVKSRTIIFKYKIAEWHLSIHLILGNKCNYIIDTGLGLLCTAPVLECLFVLFVTFFIAC